MRRKGSRFLQNGDMLFYDEEGEDDLVGFLLCPDLFFQTKAFFHRGIDRHGGQKVGHPQPGEQEDKGTAGDHGCHQQPVLLTLKQKTRVVKPFG